MADDRTTDPLDLTDRSVIKVLWAAMCAMTQDIHSPQDNLTAEEWTKAEGVFSILDEVINGN